MKYVKNFNEYKNSCMTEHSVFEELSSEQDGIVYITYFPKENEEDDVYIRTNRNMLWDFFNAGYKYANLGGFRSCISSRSLWKNASCLKVGLYNGILVAASIYTSFQKGMKCVGITATTDEVYRNIGKNAVIHIVKEDINLVGNF